MANDKVPVPLQRSAALSKDIKKALTSSIAFLDGVVSGFIVPDEAGNQYKAAELILRTFAPNRMDLLELEMIEKAKEIIDQRSLQGDDWYAVMPKSFLENKRVYAAIRLMEEEAKLIRKEQALAEGELRIFMAKTISQ